MVAYPRVLGVMVLVIAITISASFMFFSTDVGKEAFIDMQHPGRIVLLFTVSCNSQ